jgi:hypothetical protein
MAKPKTEIPVKKTVSADNNLSALFGKKNFMIMGAGLVLMALGYVAMIGGGAENPAVFNKEEIYSSTRITVAPILILVGIAINIYAILAKNK